MITNSWFRAVVASLVVVSMGLGTAPAFAFSGNVIYSPTTGDMITRTVASPAITPELNQTYQRTMRTAMTRAAAAKAVVGLIRGLQIVSTIAILATLASDLKGIWTKNVDGTNDLMVPKESTSCIPADPNCSMPQYPFRTYKSVPYNGSCASASYDDTNPPNPPTFTGYWCPGTPDKTLLPPERLNDDQLAELIKGDPRLLPILKDLDAAGFPIPFPNPEVEVMPQPIVINPTTRVNPDGSKTITQTTLEPFRTAPDAPVQWRKKEVVTEISKPALDGTTTSTSQTTVTDKGESSTPEKAPEVPATDTALPAQPKLYKQKYPTGIIGVWQTQRDAMANSPLFTIAKTLMPVVGLGGSCPTMPVNLNFSQWANFGVRDVAPPCQVWDWGRAICIVSACLLARRLIFGG